VWFLTRIKNVFVGCLCVATLLLPMRGLALTQQEAGTLLDGSLVFFADSTGTDKAVGIVISSDGLESFVLTDSHVLHGSTWCKEAASDPDPTPNLQWSFWNLGTGQGLKKDVSVTLVADDRCSDLALLKIGAGNLRRACFSADPYKSEAVRLTGPVIIGSHQIHGGEVVQLQSERSVSGTVQSIFPDQGLVIYDASTSDGYSGTGIGDLSTGLMVGIHQGGVPDGSSLFEGTDTNTIATFLTNTGVKLDVVPAGNVLPAECLGIVSPGAS
jgi:hypothetical protein